jgi:hypothetical protein
MRMPAKSSHYPAIMEQQALCQNLVSVEAAQYYVYF